MPNNGDKDNDIWSKHKQSQTPPDLLQLIKNFFNQTKKPSSDQEPTSGGAGNGDARIMPYVWIVAAVLVVIWVVSGIFLVSPAEQAVVLRFGKYQETVGPGPHWIPRFIDSRYIINTQQVNNFPYTAEMLTKDENIVSVALTVQYRIAKPKSYLFDVVGPINTLHQATSSALRQIVGQMSLDDVLTVGRQQLRDRVSQQLNATLAPYKTGLEITDVTLQPVKPPEAVTHAFDDAIKAREDEQRYINKAQAYARKVESQAKGTIARIQQLAKAYKKEIVLQAKGATARFLAVLKPYQAAPRVTGERMYLESVAHVLDRTTNILVESKGNNVLYLPIDRMLQQRLKQESLKNIPEPQSTASDDTTKSVPVSNNRPSYSQTGNAYNGGQS